MNNRIAVANDISGLGKCSLAVNIPIFASFGFEACAIPTAVLTNQSCYDTYYIQNYKVDFTQYHEAWKKSGVNLCGIYSGYFACADDVKSFFENFIENKDCIYVNDPVMGDLGERYSNCTDEMIEEMRRTVYCADVTTPNLTELCLLTDSDFSKISKNINENNIEQTIKPLAEKLIQNGTKNVVVTGIKCVGKDNMLYNAIISKDEFTVVSDEKIKGDFSGTGDIFSSILACFVFKKENIINGVKKACSFIKTGIMHTDKTNENDGISFEKILSQIEKL